MSIFKLLTSFFFFWRKKFKKIATVNTNTAEKENQTKEENQIKEK